MSDTNPEITPASAAHRTGDAILLDVREPDEWAAGHAPDATHMPLSALNATSIPSGVDVMCVCRSGGRSNRATTILRAAGINATNVTGGMTAWAAAGLPVVRDNGDTGTVI